MRILYLSQYFPPEVGATQNRAYEMASIFVKQGHDVTVLTEVPNHPSGIIHPDFRRKFSVRSKWDGIDIFRVWVITSSKKSFLNRMLFYISFMVNATIAGLLITREKYDLIYITSPPLFVGGAGLAIKIIRNIPMVFEVRDLWPDSAIELGELKNRTAISLARKLEQTCYKHAALIIVVTEGTRQILLEKNQPAKRVVFIPNGSNLKRYQFDVQGREKIRQELGLENMFVAIYAGIHGVAQGLENIIETAKILATQSQIHFLMVGNGPHKKMLGQMISKYGLNNVTLSDEVSMDEMHKYLSAADIALIPLRDIDLFKTVLPSKMFDAWACQRPIILSVNGEARRVLERADAGVYVPPEDPESLAVKLLELSNHRMDLNQMGLNGRIFVEANYSREVLAMRLMNELELLLGQV